jgi:hypothetical protein
MVERMKMKAEKMAREVMMDIAHRDQNDLAS